MNLVARMIFVADSVTYRILWVNSNYRSIVAIDMHDAKALPIFFSMEDIRQGKEENLIEFINNDPFDKVVDESVLDERSRTIRNRAWTIIEPIVHTEPDIYIRTGRGKLVKRVIDEHGVTKRVVYGWLRKYWQRGQIKNALLPNYENCGTYGRDDSENAKKRGRPRIHKVAEGKNVSKADQSCIRTAVDLYYKDGMRLKDVYQDMIRVFYRDPDAQDHPDTIGRLVDENDYPTLGQFLYWYRKLYKPSEAIIKNFGINEYNLNYRAVLGSSTAETIGPGYRYQIDATMADVYLVSRSNRSHVIGRPILYVIIDVFSRLITGLYIGLESPSWTAAGMALISMVQDKVEYCRKFGIEIEEWDWPSHHMPQRILGDRGEMETSLVDAFDNEFKVTIENTPAYRADWKGVVEQRFKLLQVSLKKNAPAYVRPNYRKRGEKDYRLDAKLDIDQFTRIILLCVIEHNNSKLKGYDRDEAAVSRDIEAIPNQLWDYGIKYRMGNLRVFSEEKVRLSVLRRDQGAVTERGIKFKHCYYTCETALSQEWFEKSRRSGRWKVDIAFDPRNMTTVFWVSGKEKVCYEPCQLTPYSRAYIGKSLWEIEEIQDWNNQQDAKRSHDELQGKIDFDERIKGIVREAENLSGDTKVEIKDINKNRQEAKTIERQESTAWLNQSSEQGKPAEIYSIDRNKRPSFGNRNQKLMKLLNNKSDKGEGDE